MGRGNTHIFSVLVPIKVGCYNVLCLFDTGSSVSLIERKVCTSPIIKDDRVVMSTAGNGSIVSQYKVHQLFSINN